MREVKRCFRIFFSVLFLLISAVSLCYSAGLTDNHLCFLLLPVEEAHIMFKRFLPLKSYLEKTLGIKIKLKVVENYEAGLNKIGQGKADLAYLDPSAYCEAHFFYKVIPLVRVVQHNQGVYRAVLVTRADSRLGKIADLKGKTIALGNVHSTSSYLMPLAMFKDVGLTLSDFKEVGYLQEEDRVALAVLVGSYDVGAMSEEVAQKYVPYGLKIIKYSEPLPQFTICASAKLDPQLRKKIKTALLKYHQKNSFSFIPANDEDYDIVRIMLKNITGRNYLVYPPKSVKVAVLPLYSALTLYDMFSPLVRYICNSIHQNCKLVIPSDFEDFVHVVKTGQVDFSYQNPYVYVLLANQGYLKALAVTLISTSDNLPKDVFRGVIIARKDSSIKSIHDLIGKRIMIVSHKSAGGYWFQKIYLWKHGIDIDKQAQIYEGKRQEEVVLAVYRHEVDAGFVRERTLKVVKDIVNLNKIKVIAYTPYFPNWPFAAYKHTSKGLALKVKKTLVNINDPKVLKKAGIQGFIPVKEGEFKKLEEYLSIYDKKMSSTHQ